MSSDDRSVADQIDTTLPIQSADEMRVEFARAQQQRRLMKRGTVVVGETDSPDRGPNRAKAPPPK